MSSGAVSKSVQDGNRASVERQIARQEIPINPHDGRTTDATDWNRQAKEAGLIK